MAVQHTSEAPLWDAEFMKVDGTPQKMSPIAVSKLSKMKKLSKLLETKYKGYDVNGHRIRRDAMKVPAPLPK